MEPNLTPDHSNPDKQPDPGINPKPRQSENTPEISGNFPDIRGEVTRKEKIQLTNIAHTFNVPSYPVIVQFSGRELVLITTSGGYAFKVDLAAAQSEEFNRNPTGYKIDKNVAPRTVILGGSPFIVDQASYGEAVASRDGGTIIARLHSREILFYQTDEALVDQPPREFARMKSRISVWGAAVSPDNKSAAIGHEREIKLVDLEDIRNGSPKIIRSFQGYKNIPWQEYEPTMSLVSISPDGALLVCGGWRGQLWFFDLANQPNGWFSQRSLKPCATFRADGCVNHFEMDTSGTRAVYAAGSTVGLLDITQAKEGKIVRLDDHRFPKHSFSSIDFHPNAHEVMIAGVVSRGRDGDTGRTAWDATIKRFDLLDPTTLKIIEEYAAQSGDCHAAYDVTGGRIITADYEGNIEIRVAGKDGMFFSLDVR